MTVDFSIITVCYNSEETIERCIKSVLKQSHKNFEYIIIDGNSKDKTNEIIKQYTDNFNGHIVHISEPDNGIYDAMNKGISIANGKIIGLLNSDDYYFDNTLEMIYNAYNDKEFKTVLTGELIFKSSTGEQLMRTSKARFLKKTNQFKNGVRHPATFVPNAIYNHVGLFNLDYKIAADAELIMRIFKAGYRFQFLNEPLLIMSDGGASNSKGIFKQLLKENKLLLNAYCNNSFLKFYFLTLAKLRLKIKENSSQLSSIYRKIENK